jgi:NADH-quinone oxidoreductase subunit G
MHPIEDESIKNIVTQFVKYEAGSEESVLALLTSALLGEKAKELLPDLDDGYISAESNVGEEEIEAVLKRMKRKESLSFVVGSDLFNHPQAENIAKILGVIESHTDFEVTIIPPSVNTLGVSLICDLDDEVGEYSIGYNEIGDFVLSSIEGKGDINMPAINQQEGTFTTLNKTVVPTHVALPFEGFCLNDIANELGLSERYTINYTSKLPAKSGYSTQEFDTLEDFFDCTGRETRGYNLKVKKVKTTGTIDELSELESYDGAITYICNPNSQKNIFTNLCSHLPTDAYLLGSAQFATASKLKDEDKVLVKVGNLEVERVFKLREDLKGTISLMPTFDLGFEGQSLSNIYRYSKVNIKQVGSK